MKMYVGEFIELVRKYFELDNAVRKHGRREDAIERWKIGKQIQAALEDGIVVVEEIKETEAVNVEEDND